MGYDLRSIFSGKFEIFEHLRDHLGVQFTDAKLLSLRSDVNEFLFRPDDFVRLKMNHKTTSSDS